MIAAHMGNVMDFRKASQLAGETYFKRHERSALPAWFNECAVISGSVNGNAWIVRYSATPAAPLKENQRWEVLAGNRVVVQTDPATGQRSVLISREVPAPIILYEAVVDGATGEVTVQIDRDLCAVDSVAFEPIAGGRALKK